MKCTNASSGGGCLGNHCVGESPLPHHGLQRLHSKMPLYRARGALLITIGSATIQQTRQVFLLLLLLFQEKLSFKINEGRLSTTCTSLFLLFARFLAHLQQLVACSCSLRACLLSQLCWLPQPLRMHSAAVGCVSNTTASVWKSHRLLRMANPSLFFCRAAGTALSQQAPMGNSCVTTHRCQQQCLDVHLATELWSAAPVKQKCRVQSTGCSHTLF